MVRRSLVGALVLAALWPAVLSAQLSWDAPPLVGPDSPDGLGLFLAGPDPGSHLGGLVTWRDDTASFGIGYRVGIGEDASGHAAGLGGIDVSGVLANGTEDARFKALWWTGLGGGVGRDLTVSWPFGVIVGWTGQNESAVFAPYGGAHVVLDLSTKRRRHADLRAAFDLGMDLRVIPRCVLSFGASVGGRQAFAVGVALPTGLGH